MLTSFEVTNFRGIKELKLEKLKQINVIAGKNSAGKTSLLEALFIHAGMDNLSLAMTVNAIRGVQWFASDMEQSFGPLFYDGQTEEKIKFMGWSKDAYWSRVELLLDKLTPTGREDATSSATTVMGVRPLKLSYTDSRKRKSNVSAMPQGVNFQIDPSKFTNEQRTLGVFLTSSVSAASENVNRFGKLDIAKKTNTVVSIMQGIEPRLQGLSIAPLSNRNVLYADLGLRRKVPLNYAGEGVQKIASIALAMADCKGGILLIDEIENGFHYSVLPKLWTSIADLAQTFDVQVVASTHSWECIKAASKVLTANTDVSCSLVRLDRKEFGLIAAQEYDKELLNAAVESGIEVR